MPFATPFSPPRPTCNALGHTWADVYRRGYTTHSTLPSVTTSAMPIRQPNVCRLHAAREPTFIELVNARTCTPSTALRLTAAAVEALLLEAYFLRQAQAEGQAPTFEGNTQWYIASDVKSPHLRLCKSRAPRGPRSAVLGPYAARTTALRVLRLCASLAPHPLSSSTDRDWAALLALLRALGSSDPRGAAAQLPAAPAPWLAVVHEGAARARETLEGLQALRAHAGLRRTPYRVEAYDVSHLQGQGMVAGQAVLTAGALNPTEYRCYDVADAPAADDCAALALALQQRFATQVAPPDLLLVDGGKGQLSAARGRLRHLGLAIPVVALSKREELLYFAGRRAPLRLPRGSPALRLLQRARDEAHATANLGHRAMRYTPLRSCLDGVPGLGQARAAALLMQFRTADALKAASPEALQAVPGIGPVLGAKVHAHLQSQGDTRALQIGRKQLQDLNLEGIVSAELAMSTGKFALGLEGSDADEAAMAERAADAWWDAKYPVLALHQKQHDAVSSVLQALCAALQPQQPPNPEALMKTLEPFSPSRNWDPPIISGSHSLPPSPNGTAPTTTTARPLPEAGAGFRLTAAYGPTDHQRVVIGNLVKGAATQQYQILKGGTGTGKTFVMANVVAEINKPTLVLAPNKVLAAQLCTEFKELFPDNCVEYFVSFYDYYRPESYKAVADVYLEKVSQINDDLDRLRHAATQALVERRDTIIVASVSCIYGLGMPQEYLDNAAAFALGDAWSLPELRALLRNLSYSELLDASAPLTPGEYACEPQGESGGKVLVSLPHRRSTLRLVIGPGDNGMSVLKEMALEDTPTHGPDHPADSAPIRSPDLRPDSSHAPPHVPAAVPGQSGALQSFVLYPAKHHLFLEGRQQTVMAAITAELEDRVEVLRDEGRQLAAQRLWAKTTGDLKDLEDNGWCKGIENYSRHLAGRAPGQPPSCLLDYFPKEDWLLLVDESHVTVPQVRSMSEGDRRRKSNLVEHGFRLPSALDNRPLTDEEFWERVPLCIFTSATPGNTEQWMVASDAEETDVDPVELIMRPTGITDPDVSVRPVAGAMDDLLGEIYERVAKNERVLVTALTKRAAEELSSFLVAHNVKAVWLHSDVKSLERIEILTKLRSGEHDVLVGVNLLREGLDLPEVSLVAILDADKQGFLRSVTSLIQTIGRAARHPGGRAILYADRMTPSMEAAIAETNRRRALQEAYNRDNGIEPRPIHKKQGSILLDLASQTPSGSSRSARSAAAKRQADRESLTPEQLQVYDAVWLWRKQAATALRRKPWRILVAKTLLELAKAQPSDMQELRGVFGIGPVKADAYGQELLEVVAAAKNGGGAEE